MYSDEPPVYLRVCPLYADDLRRKHTFKTPNPNKAYCSEECRKRAKLYRWRERQFAKKGKEVKNLGLFEIPALFKGAPPEFFTKMIVVDGQLVQRIFATEEGLDMSRPKRKPYERKKPRPMIPSEVGEKIRIDMFEDFNPEAYQV